MVHLRLIVRGPEQHHSNRGLTIWECVKGGGMGLTLDTGMDDNQVGHKECGCQLVVFFVFSNFYSLNSHNKTRVASTNLQRNICRNRIESRTSFDLVMVIEVHVCWFLSWMHKSSQLCSLLSVK